MLLQNIYQSALLNSPDKTAIFLDDQSCTYHQLDLKVQEYVQKMTSLGVVKGNTVGFFSENSLELVYLYFACFRIGAIAVPASYYNSPVEVEYEYEHSKVSIVFVSKKKYPEIESLHQTHPRFKNLFIVENFDSMETGGNFSGSVHNEFSSGQPAIVLYTSGSTGKPKGVTHSHFSLYNSALSRCSTLIQDNNSVFLTSSYLCHGAAPSIGLFPSLLSGGTTVFMKKYTPEFYIELMDMHGVTHAVSSPTQWNEMLDLTDKNSSAYRTLKYVSAGGDKVPVELQIKFKEKMGIDLAISLGMTECGVSLTTRPGQPFKPDSLGTLCDGYEIKLLDEQGSEVPTGEIGEFVIKSNSCAIGYWNDAENTNRFFKNGWYHSGDLGRKDADGYYYFEGRSKNIIVRSGGNIAPGEVEDVLVLHQGVRQCGVCGVPDEKQGETVFAFVVPEDIENPPSSDMLNDFLKGKIADRKLPEFWHFVERIPMNSEGSKIDRKKMKEEALRIVSGEK